MATITVKINNTTRRGKYVIGLLRELARTGKDIHLENTPNAETIKAIIDAEEGRVVKIKGIDELFDAI